jgi:hypothetical protein
MCQTSNATDKWLQMFAYFTEKLIAIAVYFYLIECSVKKLSKHLFAVNVLPLVSTQSLFFKS